MKFEHCPFCGGDDIELERFVTKVNRDTPNPKEFIYWEAGCYDCGARVSRPTQEEAIEAWNTRGLPNVNKSDKSNVVTIRQDVRAALLLLAQTCAENAPPENCRTCPLHSLYSGDCLLENIDFYDLLVENIEEHEKVLRRKQNVKNGEQQ